MVYSGRSICEEHGPFYWKFDELAEIYNNLQIDILFQKPSANMLGFEGLYMKKRPIAKCYDEFGCIIEDGHMIEDPFFNIGQAHKSCDVNVKDYYYDEKIKKFIIETVCPICGKIITIEQE